MLNIENETPFAVETLFLADESGRPLLVPVIKATYSINSHAELLLSDEQLPLELAGKPWGDPETTSYKYEPETAFFKPASDVVLIGHAHAPRVGATSTVVTIQVGTLEKSVAVIGDRFWRKSLLATSISEPEPFEKIPLIWERAFGGWDRSPPDAALHTFEPRNPVGAGFRSKRGPFEEHVRLPNLEDPRRVLKQYGEIVPPACFGYVSPHWQPRAALAGTYDDAWTNHRMPLLPTDFDRRFFNAASPGLIADGYLRGDEPVRVENVQPGGTMAFRLPGVPPPRIDVSLRDVRDVRLDAPLDTVIINADENLVLLLWRAHLPLRNGPHDVAHVRIATNHESAMPARTS